jgi:hypothetical protein
MRYQARKFTCGPAAICNAMTAYGVVITEEEACETTPFGTNERKMVAGIRKHGKAAEVFRTRDSLAAMEWLDTSIMLGTPAILCVDDWSHWVTLIGKLGANYWVADSAHAELLVLYSIHDLMARWAYDKRYYGIGVV